MKNEIEKAANKVATSTAAKLTSELRNMAYTAHWPTDIIVQISIQAEDANLVISYPDTLSTQIDNLEYGTPDTAPNAVFRPFIARHAKFLEQEVSEAIGEILIGIGAFN